MAELWRYDPRVTVAAGWGCTERVETPPKREPCLAVVAEEAEAGPPATDVFLFICHRKLWRGYQGIRYEIPEVACPLEEVFHQVPVSVVVKDAVFFVPPDASLLEALGEVLDVGPFSTEYLGPDRQHAVLMLVAKAMGPSPVAAVAHEMAKIFPGEGINEKWVEAAARKLQTEGYGIWTTKDGKVYVSAEPTLDVRYEARRQRAIERITATYVPPYVLAVRSTLSLWLRRMVREEVAAALSGRQGGLDSAAPAGYNDPNTEGGSN